MISILTPTIRKEGLQIIRDSLKNQTHKDYEWLIGSPFDPKIKEAIWVKDDFKGGFWTLNRIYNKMFKQAKGHLIVSWQDNIWIPPEGIKKFYVASKFHHGVISGVGDQYERLDKYGKPEIKVWSDPRKNLNNGSFYEIYPQDAEWNWCAFFKKDIFIVGGMDEGLDFLGFGGDQLQVGRRMNDFGIKFYIDQDNESYTIRHNRDKHGGEDNWNKNHVLFNGKYSNRIEELKKTKKWPCVGYI